MKKLFTMILLFLSSLANSNEIENTLSVDIAKSQNQSLVIAVYLYNKEEGKCIFRYYKQKNSLQITKAKSTIKINDITIEIKNLNRLRVNKSKFYVTKEGGPRLLIEGTRYVLNHTDFIHTEVAIGLIDTEILEKWYNNKKFSDSKIWADGVLLPISKIFWSKSLPHLE